MKHLIFILLFIPCICQAQIPADKLLRLGTGLVYMGMKIYQANVPYLSFNRGLQIGIKLRI